MKRTVKKIIKPSQGRKLLMGEGVEVNNFKRGENQANLVSLYTNIGNLPKRPNNSPIIDEISPDLIRHQDPNCCCYAIVISNPSS